MDKSHITNISHKKSETHKKATQLYDLIYIKLKKKTHNYIQGWQSEQRLPIARRQEVNYWQTV